MNKNNWQKNILDYLRKKKNLLLLIVAFLVIFLVLKSPLKKNKAVTPAQAKTQTVNIDRNFEFPALDNQGKATKNKIQFKVKGVEKTNQVLVKDQMFTAKNNKLFLIINLELKNDATTQLNIIPGDLVRLSVGQDKDNRFAPDLHNNLVPVAAISTRIDRVGFVIPDNAKSFIIYIGEIEGIKQQIPLNFPS